METFAKIQKMEDKENEILVDNPVGLDVFTNGEAEDSGSEAGVETGVPKEEIYCRDIEETRVCAKQVGKNTFSYYASFGINKSNSEELRYVDAENSVIVMDNGERICYEKVWVQLDSQIMFQQSGPRRPVSLQEFAPQSRRVILENAGPMFLPAGDGLQREIRRASIGSDGNIKVIFRDNPGDEYVLMSNGSSRYFHSASSGRDLPVTKSSLVQLCFQILYHNLAKSVYFDATPIETNIDRTDSTQSEKCVITIKLSNMDRLENFGKLFQCILQLHENREITLSRWKCVPSKNKKQKNTWSGNMSHITLGSITEAYTLIKNIPEWKPKLSFKDIGEGALCNMELSNTFPANPLNLDKTAEPGEHSDIKVMRLVEQALREYLKVEIQSSEYGATDSGPLDDKEKIKAVTIPLGYGVTDSGPLDDKKKPKAFTILLENIKEDCASIFNSIVEALDEQKHTEKQPDKLKFVNRGIFTETYGGKTMHSIHLVVKRECTENAKGVSVEILTNSPTNQEYIALVMLEHRLMLDARLEVHEAAKNLTNALIKVCKELNEKHVMKTTILEFMLVNILLCAIDDQTGKKLTSTDLRKYFLCCVSRLLESNKCGVISKIGEEHIQNVLDLCRRYEFLALYEDVRIKIKAIASKKTVLESEKIFQNLKTNYEEVQLWELLQDDEKLVEAIQELGYDIDESFESTGELTTICNKEKIEGIVKGMEEYILSTFGSQNNYIQQTTSSEETTTDLTAAGNSILAFLGNQNDAGQNQILPPHDTIAALDTAPSPTLTSAGVCSPSMIKASVVHNANAIAPNIENPTSLVCSRSPAQNRSLTPPAMYVDTTPSRVGNPQYMGYAPSPSAQNRSATPPVAGNPYMTPSPFMGGAADAQFVHSVSSPPQNRRPTPPAPFVNNGYPNLGVIFVNVENVGNPPAYQNALASPSMKVTNSIPIGTGVGIPPQQQQQAYVPLGYQDQIMHADQFMMVQQPVSPMIPHPTMMMPTTTQNQYSGDACGATPMWIPVGNGLYRPVVLSPIPSYPAQMPQ